MKRTILILIGVIMNATIIHAKVIRAGDDDPQMLEKVLAAIAQIESNNRDIGVHSDGVSYGRYGITMMAVRELQRVGILDVSFNKAWLKIPEQNEYIAKLYLREMYRRTKSWYKAVKRYHGASDDDENERYAQRARNIWMQKLINRGN